MPGDGKDAACSRVALIGKCWRNTKRGHCCWPNGEPALCRKAHPLKKFGVSRVVAHICEWRIGLDYGQSGVSLFVGTLQPFKRFVGLPAERIHLRDLIG